MHRTTIASSSSRVKSSRQGPFAWFIDPAETMTQTPLETNSCHLLFRNRHGKKPQSIEKTIVDRVHGHGRGWVYD